MLTAGPNEPTADELQYQLKFLVDELCRLYSNGIRVKTPLFPDVSEPVKLLVLRRYT